MSFCVSWKNLIRWTSPELNELKDFKKTLKTAPSGHQTPGDHRRANCPCRRITLRAKGSTSYLRRAVNRQPLFTARDDS